LKCSGAGGSTQRARVQQHRPERQVNHFFVDTNLFLQCRDLPEIPWSTISAGDTVELVVPRAVQIEIDRLKSDGNSRRAKRARLANSYFRQILLASDERLIVRDANPRVEITLAPLVGTSTYSGWDLDPSKPDDSIIIELMAYRKSNADAALLSHDTYPLLIAKRLSLPFVAIPDEWLLGPESDDRDKKLHGLETRIARLEKASPIIVFR
jgi:hypothetical protein